MMPLGDSLPSDRSLHGLDDAPAGLLSGAGIETDRDAVVGCVVGVARAGILGVAHGCAGGGRVLTMLLRSGDIFDMRSRGGAPGRLVALTQARCHCVDPDAFDRAAARDPGLSLALSRQLCNQMRRMREHCADLVCKPPLARVAALLLELDGWPRPCSAPPPALAVADMADYCGVSPETLSQCLDRLEGDGALRRGSEGAVAGLDPALLRAAAAGRGGDDGAPAPAVAFEG